MVWFNLKTRGVGDKMKTCTKIQFPWFLFVLCTKSLLYCTWGFAYSLYWPRGRRMGLVCTRGFHFMNFTLFFLFNLLICSFLFYSLIFSFPFLYPWHLPGGDLYFIKLIFYNFFSIAGFHMTLLRFKRQNYRCYRDFTFTMY